MMQSTLRDCTGKVWVPGQQAQTMDQKERRRQRLNTCLKVLSVVVYTVTESLSQCELVLHGVQLDTFFLTSARQKMQNLVMGHQSRPQS
jgi:hypothetical protein